MKHRVSILAVAILSACGGGIADELGPFETVQTTCRLLPPEVYARIPEVARAYAVDLADTSRTLSIGVDSMNRVRAITASAHLKQITSLTIHASTAHFDEQGSMRNAIRTVSTGNVDAGGLQSKSVQLGAADTAKLRVLAQSAHAQCAR